MAKIQLKSDSINPFGGLFSIFKQFDRSGLRQTIDSALGKRGTNKAAFSYGDVFASLFGSYLCGGDCIGGEFLLLFEQTAVIFSHRLWFCRF